MDTETKSPEQEQQEQKDLLLESNTIKLWTKRVKDAKKYFDDDFKRMRENMEFAAGLQWADQTTVESSKYIANFVNRETNQKVSNLYAKDPKAVFRRRKRLDFQLWDESIESMQGAMQTMMQAQVAATQGGMGMLAMQQPQVVQAQALLADIEHGKTWRKLVDKVGRSLEILYHYQCDTQQPDFKFQMKQLVRRVVTTGVGFVRLNFSRQGDYAMTSTGTDDSLSMRIKRAKKILEQIDEDKLTEDDPRHEQLKQLFNSVTNSIQTGDMTNIEERLEFDFPSASSIVIDPKCKSLKGFIGARWVAQQFILPLEDVNAYFETDIKVGGKLVVYSEDGVEKLTERPGEGKVEDHQSKPLVCLWEVFDLTTKTSFFLADGHNEYVCAPEPVTPGIHRFWPIFALTFNDTEVEPGQKVHIYPPSDVELLRHPQKEWNRTREELRKHRKGNRPWYVTLEGWLAEPDKEKLGDHETNELVALKGLPPGGDLSKAITRFESAPIDQALYNTAPLAEDAMKVIGSNQSQVAPQKHVAATPAVIQEQARISGANSNVDDLDDLLSELARASGEIMLKEFSLQTVQRIVGAGAAWPEQNREDFLNEVYLDSVAASSGRPNKAVDVANAQQIGPLLMNAGANPFALIKYYCQILDANLEPSDFMPMPGLPQGQPAQAGQQASQQPPPQQLQHPGLVGQQPGGMGQPVPVQMGGAH